MEPFFISTEEKPFKPSKFYSVSLHGDNSARYAPPVNLLMFWYNVCVCPVGCNMTDSRSSWQQILPTPTMLTKMARHLYYPSRSPLVE